MPRLVAKVVKYYQMIFSLSYLVPDRDFFYLLGCLSRTQTPTSLVIKVSDAMGSFVSKINQALVIVTEPPLL